VAYVVLPSYRPKTAASLSPKFTSVKAVRNLRAVLMADLLNPVKHLRISQRRQLKNGAPLLQHNGGSRTINNYWLLIILAEGQSDRVYLPSVGTAVRSQTTDLMSQGLFEVSDRSDITRTVLPALLVAETTATVGLCSEFTSRYLSDVHANKNYSKPHTTSSKSAILNSYKSNYLLLLSLFTTADISGSPGYTPFNKIKRPEISYVPLRKWGDVQLPS